MTRLLLLAVIAIGIGVLGFQFLDTSDSAVPEAGENALVSTTDDDADSASVEVVADDAAAVVPEETTTSGAFDPSTDYGLEIDIAGEANGTIKIDLFEDVAPNHVAQITAIAKAGSYDNVVFHRVIEGFMAQTGDVEHGVLGGDMRRAGTGGSDLGNVDAEFSDLPFERGIVGMARAQNPNSANSQFFIMFAPGYFLNGQYTVIGEVTEGMEIVDQIKLGEGPNGAVIGEPDMMAAVRVTE